MTEKAESKENEISFEEFVLINAIQTDTLAQLLIEKGIISEEEFYSKLKEVQAEYESKRNA